MSNVSALFSLWAETLKPRAENESTPAEKGSPQEERESKTGAAYYIRQAINGLALTAQITGFIIWPLFYCDSVTNSLLLPLALLFISCGWWENFFTSTKIKGKQDKIAIQLHYCLPPATFPSGTSGTYQRA